MPILFVIVKFLLAIPTSQTENFISLYESK